MADSLNLFAGTSARLSVVGINATQGVAGALPIIGASHTINASLAACPDPNHIFGFQGTPYVNTECGEQRHIGRC